MYVFESRPVVWRHILNFNGDTIHHFSILLSHPLEDNSKSTHAEELAAPADSPLPIDERRVAMRVVALSQIQRFVFRAMIMSVKVIRCFRLRSSPESESSALPSEPENDS